MAKQYEVVMGLDHQGGRQEPGETYTGPAGSVKWLLEQGAIKEVPARASRSSANVEGE